MCKVAVVKNEWIMRAVPIYAKEEGTGPLPH